MTELRKQIREFLLSRGLTEQPTPNGVCYIYRHCNGEWEGQYWADVIFPSNYHSNRIEILTGYAGAFTGDEGYNIDTYKGVVENFENFLTILESTSFNSQLAKGENQYVFIRRQSSLS